MVEAVFKFRMPVGIPGEITRSNSAIVEPDLMNVAALPLAYGVPLKMVAGKVVPIVATDVIASVMYGWLVRPYPTQSSTAGNGFGAGIPIDAGIIANVLKAGYLNVKLARGTAIRGAAVFVRKTAASGKLVGDIEDTASSAECEAVPNCYFMGGADSSGITEIAYNL
jgi:hypothetical protein